MRFVGIPSRRLVSALLLLSLCVSCAAPQPAEPTPAPASNPPPVAQATTAGFTSAPAQQPTATAATVAATGTAVAASPTALPAAAPTSAPRAGATPTSQPQAQRPPSSAGLIEEALAKGAIDQETALLYSVYAAFGDSRLPSPYQGESGPGDDYALLRAALDFDTLSPQTRTALQPFLLPPSAPGSWLELGQGLAAGESSATHRVSWSPAAAPAIEWGTVPTANGKVKVWYQKRYPGDEAKAQGVAQAIDAKIWDRLVNLMGREPKPDGGLANNGGDSRLDIYLVHFAYNGLATPYTPAMSTGGYAAHILLDSNQPLGDETHAGIIQSATHELMHAIQFTYEPSAGWGEVQWLMEASSMWAENYVYPKANSEHLFAPGFLETTHLSLEDSSDDREYGAYLALYYLEKMGPGAEVVRQTWENVETYDSLEALDKSLPDYEAATWWAGFAAANWNQAPEDLYNRRDGLKAGAAAGTTPLTLGGKSDDQVALPAYLPHLSALYYHFTFPDDSVSTVTFYNGLNLKLGERRDLFGRAEEQDGIGYEAERLPEDTSDGDLGSLVSTKEEKVGVQLLYKVQGQPWQHRDMTDIQNISFCRDAKAERLEEMVLIFSNGQYKDRGTPVTPPGLAPVLRVTNIGCWRWQGTAEHTVPHEPDVQEKASSTLVLQRHDKQWQSEVGHEEWHIGFHVLRGQTQWQISGKQKEPPYCTLSGEASEALPGGGEALSIFVGILRGPLYRSYDGAGPGIKATYNEVCPPPPGEAIPRHTEVVWGSTSVDFRADETQPQDFPLVSADGRSLKGSMTEESGGKYEWNLVAVRE